MGELFGDYIRIAGWSLCFIEPGSKGPSYHDWNERSAAITDPAVADVAQGVGLMHAYSGTAVLDIDNLKLATVWLEQRGVALPSYLTDPANVHILSGRPDRDKLLFRLSTPLRTIKPKGSGLELRCATADGKSVQDVLPFSVHPETKKPYRWRGDWTALPYWPAPLLQVWRDEITTAPDIDTPTAAPTGASDERLHMLVKGRDPDCGYDEWNEIGRALHHETGGAMRGLAVWDAWSKTSKKGKYKGLESLRTHWISFRSNVAHPTTIASLERAVPAQPDEFEAITPSTASDSAAIEPAARAANRLELIAKIQARVPYVLRSKRYFDMEQGQFFESGEELYTTFASWFGPQPKKGQRHKVVQWITETRGRIEIDAPAFHPGESDIFVEGDKSYVNLYRNAFPEPIEPTAAEREKIEWLFDRIDDPIFRKYLRQFYGYAVQHPGVKIRTAPLMWSLTTGNGKTTMMSTIPKLLVGEQYSHEASFQSIEEKFGGFLESKWHICMTELKVGTRKEADMVMARIKPWIADNFVEIRAMRRDAVNIPNHVLITATSNKPDAILIDSDDRRFAVCNLTAGKVTDDEGIWLHDEFLNLQRAPGVLWHYFLNVDISDFNPNADAPHTAARQDMIREARGDDADIINDLIARNVGVFQNDCGCPTDIKATLRQNLGVATVRRIGNLMYEVKATRRELKIRGHKDRVVWIWRNADRWGSCSQQELREYVDNGNVGV